MANMFGSMRVPRKGWLVCGAVTDFWKRSMKLAPNGLRNVAGVCRIDICEEDEFSKEHLPVRIGKLTKTVPVQRAGACLKQSVRCRPRQIVPDA